MKITKEELKELNEKGNTEFQYFMSGKEFWETLEVEK